MANRPPESKWLQEKLGKFSSSSIGPLFVNAKKAGDVSVGAMTYIEEKATELLTGTSRNIESVFAIEWGNKYEPEAAELLAKEYEGFKYYGKEDPTFFPLTDYSGGSPDAVIEFPSKIVFEIKSPENPVNHLKFLRCEFGNDLKEEEKKYWQQLQMNMACLAKHLKCSVNEIKGVFVSYCPLISEQYSHLRLKQIDVYPDEDFQKELLPRILNAEAELKKIIRSLLKPVSV